MLEVETVMCPYCGEGTDVEVDISAGAQQYIEDCQVCCRPIEFVISIEEDGKSYHINARRDDE